MILQTFRFFDGIWTQATNRNQKCDLFDAYLYTIKNNKLEAVLFYVVQICQGRNQYLP